MNEHVNSHGLAVPPPGRMNELLLELMRGINAQTFATIGNKVVRGPFMGMEIPQETPWDDGNASTKLLGAYEFELHDVLTEAIARKPQTIVNVGCAEGYYAIGLARISPASKVLAIDLDQNSLHMCEYYARRNAVRKQIEVYQGCRTAQELNVLTNTEGHHLFFMDCEVAELELLNKRLCPVLEYSDIIVECHDFMLPGGPLISDVIGRAFCDTHKVEVIKPRLPDYTQYEFLKTSPTVMTILAVTEKRPMPTLWLACWANRKGDIDG